MAQIEEDILQMNRDDLKRLYLLRKVLDKLMTQKEVSKILRLSTRQVRRLILRIKNQGDKGVTHRLRGKPSNHRIPDSIRERALRIVQAKYHDFGPTLASEKLLEEDKIRVNHDTLRSWFNQKGIAYNQRKPRPHKFWRPRKPSLGQMIQMDGSHHAWLETRGPKLVLMAYIDDATNLTYGRFYDYEGTLPAMDSFFRYSLIYGLPQSIYFDKHTTYKSWKKPTIEEELEGVVHKSQFQRALEELGVEAIHANSPQAKGRVERLFKTLQDRLVKELRLKKANTLTQANRVMDHFLIGFNHKFKRKAMNPADLHRNPPKDDALISILSVKHKHPLRNDSTIFHRAKLYLIRDYFQNPLPKSIQVEERIDGKIYFLNDQKEELFFQELKNPPKINTVIIQKPKLPRKKTIPSKSHPFRSDIRDIRTKQSRLIASEYPNGPIKPALSAEILQKFEQRLKNIKQTELINH